MPTTVYRRMLTVTHQEHRNLHGTGKICLALLLTIFLTASAVAASGASEKNLLLASDIHFNPMADASLVPKLVDAEPAHWETIFERTQPRAFSPYGQDTNWWLLKSALEQMHKTMPRPALFVIAGDMLAHGLPAKYRAATQDNDLQHYRTFVLKTVQFLALQLRSRWSNTQILLTPGNNDDDCQDYSILAGGAFLSDTAPIAQELAKGNQELAAGWKTLGSYSVLPLAIPGIRIVSLNTVFFSAKYQPKDLQNACAGVQSNASTQAFSWLQQTLSDARSANQKVWLMFHIPPGIDGYASTHPQGGPVPPVGEECLNDIVPMWVPEWTAKFDTLLESDQSTVVATFAGHTHTDDFRVFGTGSKSQFVLIDPPISPVYGQNPAFRLLDFSGGGEIQNYTTYYLTDLTAPDKNLHGKWKKEYRFSREWKAKEVNSTNLSRIYGEITSQDAAREQWLRLYNVSSDATKLPPNVARGLYCAIAELSVQGYGHCACHPPK